MDISRKTHEVRLRLNYRDIDSQAIGLFMKKRGKKKETFLLEPEALSSFGNTSFSENEAGLTAEH